MSSVSPDTGPITGGTSITITGSGFTTGATVKIGKGYGPGPTDIAATNVDVVSPTEITATTGRGAKLGIHNLFVTTQAGTSSERVGDRYSYVPTPAWGFPADIADGKFDGVSCPDASDCTAVGDDNNGQAFYATETAGTWGPATDIAAPGGDYAFAVSCPDASDCTAVGDDSNNGEGFYATETAGSWGTATDITTPGGAGLFSGVSCPDASDCTAVGGDDSNGQAFYATETGGSWGPATEIIAPGGGGDFNGVSCLDTSDCTAVGDDNNGQAFYATETGGSWGPATEIAPPGGGGLFSGVSCPDTSDCTAVGDDNNGRAFYATETGGSWGPATQIAAPGGADALGGVSCPDASDCTAVGGYVDNYQAIYATETGGTWGPTTQIAAPGGNGVFKGVSCHDASDCTAVGGDNNQQGFYDREAVPPTPTVTAVSPNGGPTSGGTPITITGTGFVPGALVEIGQGNGPGPTAVAATNIDVVSSTEITATTGANAKPGAFDVWVLSPGGTNTYPGKAVRYTYTN